MTKHPMNDYRERTYPAWLIFLVSISGLCFVLLYVSRPISFPDLEPGDYLGEARIESQEIPLLIRVTKDPSVEGVFLSNAKDTFFKQPLEINHVPFFTKTFRPVNIPFGGQTIKLHGAIVKDNGVEGVFSKVDGTKLGTLSASKVQSQQMGERDVSSLTVWKQFQELSRLRAIEQEKLDVETDEQKRIREIIQAKKLIVDEGTRILGASQKLLDEKNTARKKLEAEVQVLRGRVVLAQRLSPQGKFVTLSRQSLRAESDWFLRAVQ